MYNATNSAPHRPSAYRVDALRTLSLRSTAQLNDLFITPRRNVAYSIAALFGSTQRFVCYNASPRGSAFHRAPRLPAAHRASIQLNDLFVTFRASTRSDLARRVAAPRIAPQRNDLFVIFASSRSASQRDLSRRGATHLSATQRFVYYNASPCIAPQHITLLRADQQRNELKLN